MTGPVDDFLASCAPADRQVLQTMVHIAHDLVPAVAQTTSYRLPALTVGPTSKHVVCGFAAGRHFLSWYPFSSATITTLADELAGFETTKGSVHFTAEEPLPDDLVRQLLLTRLAEFTD